MFNVVTVQNTLLNKTRAWSGVTAVWTVGRQAQRNFLTTAVICILILMNYNPVTVRVMFI